ncbi:MULTISPECIES: agmatinase [unclassified Synechocystis]|uniref:agmatinase n=1 Tax=unclassified Synechocystis TaxID=2640012 RepID=UPI0003F5E999|nr:MULTISPECIES: agmatinase [unclassified Synechocystis]AIE72946.1 Agmatinase [Synechocystis sp. PCC 6714]MCT0252577.1 agmatinase [Synechocystis sp. CS-94]
MDSFTAFSSGPKQFLESEATTPYADAAVVVVPIPYEATTSYRKGCQYGPGAVLEASDQLEAYDEELATSPCHDLGIYTCVPLADSNKHPALEGEAMLSEVCDGIVPFLRDGKFVVAIGGEHAITTGVVQAMQKVNSDPFTVVQIDAHGDMRYEFEGSRHNHACVMRRVLELGLPTLPIAIRAICQEEAELIKEKNIPVFWAREMADNPHWIDQAIASIATDKVFLTIDMDGFDPGFLPGVGTPEPGGLGWYDGLKFFRRLFQTKQVIGCDLMELAPVQGSVVSEFSTAKLAYKLMGYWGESQRRKS